MEYFDTEPLSLTSIQIKMFRDSLQLSTGTAFFYSFREHNFLVTNWHNASGRRPDNLKCVNKNGAIPDKIKAYIPYYTDQKKKLANWLELEIPLYNGSRPNWMVHPKFNQKVDLVVMPLKVPDNAAIYAVNDSKGLGLNNLLVKPGMDVFVLGYPEGLTGGALFPIWKRGSFASIPQLDLDGMPKILIDTATRRGMSGSPVYAIYRGNIYDEKSKSVAYLSSETGRRFIGIYSGRVDDDTFSAQIGIVWKEKAILETIHGNVIGANPELVTDIEGQNMQCAS